MNYSNIDQTIETTSTSTRSKAPQSKALKVSETSVTTSVSVPIVDRDTLTIPHKDEFPAALGYSEDDDIYFRLLPAKDFDATNPEHRKIFPKLFWHRENTNQETGEVTQEYIASKEKLRYKNGKLYKTFGTKESPYHVSSNLNAYFAAKSKEGFCPYIVVNPGGQNRKVITEARVIFWEIDDIDKDEQKTRFKEYSDKWGGGFAIETLKSIHCYIRLDQSLENKDIQPTLQRLIQLMRSDPNVNDPARLMRVPGFDHIKIKGNEVNRFPITVHKSWDGTFASWDQINSDLPVIEKPEIAKTETGRPVTAYEPGPMKGAIPLSKCISIPHRAAILNCVDIGKRNSTAYSLACDLIGAERYLYLISQEFSESAEELYEKYSDQCETAKPGELDSVWERAESNTEGPCLSPDVMQNCIDAFYKPDLTEFRESLERKAAEAWTDKPEQAQILFDKFEAIGKSFTEYQWRILTVTNFDELVKIICIENQLPIEKPVMCLVEGCAYDACRRIFEQVPEVTDLSECKGYYWLDFLKRFKKATHDTLAIHRVYGSSIRYNTLRMQPEVNGKEVYLDDLKAEMETIYRETLIQGKDETISAFMTLAKRNSYNPVIEYLESCKPKLEKGLTAETILLKCFNLDPKMIKPEIWKLYIEYIKRFLIGAVARAYKPGCDHRTVLVLKGDQYIGKSKFFSTLAGEWFDDSVTMDSVKDDQLKMNRVWLCEWQELESIIGIKAAGLAKRWISTYVENFRPPYERAVKSMPRPSVICATVNEITFLTDTTGNSRYWVVDTGANYLDLNWLKEHRDAIWAYAVDLHESGVKFWFDNKNTEDMELFKLQNQLNEEYAAVDPWEAVIDAYLEGLDQVSMKGVTTQLDLTIDKQNKGTEAKIGKIMNKLGWFANPKQSRVDGVKVRLWKPKHKVTQEILESSDEF